MPSYLLIERNLLGRLEDISECRDHSLKYTRETQIDFHNCFCGQVQCSVQVLTES